MAATPKRLDKIGRLAALLGRLAGDDVDIAVAFLSGAVRQGALGVGGAALRETRGTLPSPSSTLTLRAVDAAFARMTAASGPGATMARAGMLRDLLARATSEEQDFLVRLIAGELRQGALEGVLVDAVARAADVKPAHLRRAAMLAGDLAPVAHAALAHGAGALDRFVLQPFQPVRAMLADSAEDVAAAMEDLGEAALEYKLDGARIQVHKSGDEVRVYSRTLREVTPSVPEVVALARALPARDAVLDGEAIALRPDGTPQPFQITMSRFGRSVDIEALRRALPIAPFFFDLLYLDGQPLVDEPQARRTMALDDLAPASAIVPRLLTSNRAEADAFLARALAAGHEGVMAKAPGAAYEAGRRAHTWLKIKPARTLDLVVFAAEWGHGRRRGTLSNLHLGARDAERGGFVMLGKTFKGMTDAMLAWQTEKLQSLELARDDRTVYVRPELVVEIAFNDVQASSQYPGGLALRFARVKRYREDKRAADADSFAAVQEIYRRTTGLEPPPRR